MFSSIWNKYLPLLLQTMPDFSKITSICALWYILFFGACTGSEQTTELLAHADSILRTQTDSAVFILDRIADVKLSNRQEADYWRLRTTSHILLRKSTVGDSMIVSALNYYKEHDMQKELKETYTLLLNHLSWKSDTSSYNRYMDEALGFAKQANDSLLIYIMLRSIANDFRSKDDNKSAYRYYAKATEYNDFYSSTFYMAALTYSQIENNDTIDYWIQKAIDLAKQQKDTAGIRHYYRNYADMQIRLKEYDKAITNIKNMERYNTEIFSVAPYMMAEIFMQQHQLDSALFYINKMLDQDFGEEENNRSFMFTPKGLAFFQSIIDYAKGGTFNFGLIGRHFDSMLFDQDKSMKKFEEQVITKQKLSIQNQNLTIKKQRIQLLLLSIILVVSIGSVLIYLYIKKKKDRFFQMEEKMESIQKLMADVSIDLKGNRENSSYFKKVLLQQLGLIRFTASNPTSHNQEMLQRMAKITNDEIPVDSLIVWGDLYNLIDSLYDSFYTKLKNACGSALNEKEMQLCSLLCVSFTTKEISVITQQSIRTIYQRKTTIREKLNMQQGEDIVEFIRQQPCFSGEA